MCINLQNKMTRGETLSAPAGLLTSIGDQRRRNSFDTNDGTSCKPPTLHVGIAKKPRLARFSFFSAPWWNIVEFVWKAEKTWFQTCRSIPRTEDVQLSRRTLRMPSPNGMGVPRSTIVRMADGWKGQSACIGASKNRNQVLSSAAGGGFAEKKPDVINFQCVVLNAGSCCILLTQCPIVLFQTSSPQLRCFYARYR